VPTGAITVHPAPDRNKTKASVRGTGRKKPEAGKHASQRTPHHKYKKESSGNGGTGPAEKGESDPQEGERSPQKGGFSARGETVVWGRKKRGGGRGGKTEAARGVILKGQQESGSKEKEVAKPLGKPKGEKVRRHARAKPKQGSIIARKLPESRARPIPIYRKGRKA